ncbi:hypothetical protein BDBG_04105 [Blastomyces gilchristii SLH14081]|uniref:Uncharacterized protein n=1 Tax=Blastomyces gilchristii (strain SLH14081) TaxID=559298 RepID=A0A179UJF0_BLAGS|nr:uncharacterized protein BDBG_04105 [Blastomyces gilchristii SLH14081]OAT08114.1 hypothetical protein BDBG_04105 [Blastomyces gilchristii SLH14081]
MSSYRREDKEITELCRLNSAVFLAGLRYIIEEKLQIELLRVTVSETKLSPEFSLNDHTGSYATVLAGEGSGVAVERAGEEPDTDEPTGRRDNISLQGTVTTTAAAREAGEEGEEDVAMRAVLLQLINTAVFIFN